jgi:hypothetical protein
VSSNGSPGKFSLFLEKNESDLIVGISGLADALNADQLVTIQRAVEQQGFSVEQATLNKFVGPKAVKELFWSADAAAPEGDLLFFGHGTKGTFPYEASAATTAQKRRAMVIILDAERRPIAADGITLAVPQLPR